MVSSMVNKIPLLCLLVLIVSLPACRQLDPTLNVMSFNIRYNNPADGSMHGQTAGTESPVLFGFTKLT